MTEFETLRLQLADVQDALKRKDDDSIERRGNVDSQLGRLLKLQEQHIAEEAERKRKESEHEVDRVKHRRKVVRQILAIVSGIVVVAGGGTVTYAQLAPDSPPEVNSSDVRDAVVEESKQAQEHRAQETERIDRLEDIAIDAQIEREATQVQLVDGIDYIGKKIDKAHPRQAGDVPEPESFKAAKKIRRKAAVRERLMGGDPE